MKKLLIMLSFALFVSSFVSASYYGNDLASGLGYGMNQLIYASEQMFGPFFSAILGGSGDMLFERILFLAIILAIVYIVTSEMEVFKGNRAVIWIISISVALLSTRFLSESNLVQTVLLPYSVLGVTISSVIPILIYFKFVHSFDDNAVVRKMLWIFFIVIFIGIWGARYDDLGELSWIYMGSAVAALIFLLFDGTIRRLIVRQEIKDLDVGNREGYMRRLRKDLGDLEDDMRKGYVDENVYKKIRKRLQKQMKTVMKN
ncbi:hypothetical protein KAI32_03900 [Candidatus Pacearchaeota archaeon]|nr:hypothetical protein [Candidatus Pacearchaeota archaeon]